MKGADGSLRDVQEGDVLSNPSVIARLDDSDYLRDQRMAQERLAQLRAKLSAAEANAENARTDLTRQQRLARDQATSASALEAASAKMKTTAADVNVVTKEIAAAELDLQQASDRLANCSLVVPFPDATVAAMHVAKDERIVADNPVIVLLDVNTSIVSFGVPDYLVGRIQPGQQLDVACDAAPNETFSGTITKISPAADERTRTFLVELTIGEPRGLRPGMIVSIRIGQPRMARLIPMNAVRRGKAQNEFTVFQVVQENGRSVARQRRIQLGMAIDHRIALKSGSHVAPGDMIVVSGASHLHDGQCVRLIDKSASHIDRRPRHGSDQLAVLLRR